jgi:hemolysin III
MRTEAGQTAGEVPFLGRWNATRAERIVDGIIHVVGLVFAVSAGSILLALAFFRTNSGEYVAAVIYVMSLLTVLSISLAYNQWPLTPVKWVLRRVDHSAIYLLIAGTYTPFLVQLPDDGLAKVALSAVWLAAAAGVAVKILFPGRYDRLAVGFYLATGWSGIVMANELQAALPASTLALLGAGGVVYTIGVIFYTWRSLKFQTAVWHCFVVVGAGLHCSAVMDCFVIARL